MSSAQTDAWIADIGIGVGAAAIVAGVVLFVTGGAKEEESGPPAPQAPPPQASWGVRAVGDAHGGGALLTRTF